MMDMQVCLGLYDKSEQVWRLALQTYKLNMWYNESEYRCEGEKED